jgi:hypothetical protein
VLGIPTVADDVGVGAEEDLDRRLGESCRADREDHG